MCFNLSWNTRFSDNLIQLWLSHQMPVGSIATSNKPDSNFQSQTASVHVEQAAMYSTLAVLSATLVCFLLNHHITVEPKFKQHLEVLFLSLTFPTQFESVNPCNLNSQSRLNRRPYSTVPFMYLITCFAAIM